MKQQGFFEIEIVVGTFIICATLTLATIFAVATYNKWIMLEEKTYYMVQWHTSMHLLKNDLTWATHCVPSSSTHTTYSLVTHEGTIEWMLVGEELHRIVRNEKGHFEAALVDAIADVEIGCNKDGSFICTVRSSLRDYATKFYVYPLITQGDRVG